MLQVSVSMALANALRLEVLKLLLGCYTGVMAGSATRIDVVWPGIWAHACSTALECMFLYLRPYQGSHCVRLLCWPATLLVLLAVDS
ncbi:hypothetical protein BC834DRAFT_879260 [Gloeopeniophorella convolvens]|nr:hypothetical protein BC834DRAFT_879260 [Gloeopeniophorella convolvens]